MIMERVFAMPNAETFSIKPIGAFVDHYLQGATETVDLFARNGTRAKYRNDLNPNTLAEFHMDAAEFAGYLSMTAPPIEVALFDPPYSPRQISECYQQIGKPVTTADTQNAALYKRCRDALDKIIKPGGVVLSFGWHSNGMGVGRSYVLEHLLLVAHGGAHNDTICLMERKSL